MNASINMEINFQLQPSSQMESSSNSTLLYYFFKKTLESLPLQPLCSTLAMPHYLIKPVNLAWLATSLTSQIHQLSKLTSEETETPHK